MYCEGHVNRLCKHKSEFRFGQNPPIHNPTLRKVIQEYEKFHFEATRSVNVTYDLLRSIGDPTDIENRYIIVEEPLEGLGNFLVFMISSYVLALLTNRVLLVHFHHFNADSLLCQPFAGSDWVLPSSFSLAAARNQGPSKLLEFGNDVVHRHFLQTADPWRDTQIAYGRGNQYIVPALFLCPPILRLLSSWFPTRNVATPLAQYLLHPRDEVWNTIVGSFSSRPANTLTIGLQCRNEKIQDMFDCLHSIVPHRTHIYIASLTNYTQEARESFPGVTVHQKYAEATETHDLHQSRTALHDMWLMSLTDETVLGSHSTFGYVANALKGRPCLYHLANIESSSSHSYVAVGREVGREWRCAYEQSHEPCFHILHKQLWAFNGTSADLFNTLMACDDFPRSYKLRVEY